MEPVTYAVHTHACIFLLDAEGVCRWIAPRTGVIPPEIRGVVGAQFVACMHPDLDGLLAGEIVIGAAALFVKKDPATDKLVLMRTGTIAHVEQRGSSMPPPGPVHLPDETLDLPGGSDWGVPSAPAPSPSRGGDTVPPPAWAIGTGEYEEVPEGQVIDGGTTVTLTLPLYRAHAPLKLPQR